MTILFAADPVVDWHEAGLMTAIYPVGVPLLLIFIFGFYRKQIEAVMTHWQNFERDIKRKERESRDEHKKTRKRGITVVQTSSKVADAIKDIESELTGPSKQTFLKKYPAFRGGGIATDGATNEDGVHPTVKALAAIFSKYDPDCWWMISALLVTRTAQTSLLIFLKTPEVQATFGAIIALCCVVVTREKAPYRMDSDDAVGLATQWLLFIFMSMLLLLRVGVIQYIPQVLIGWLLLLLGVGLVVHVGLIMVYESRNGPPERCEACHEVRRENKLPGIGQAYAALLSCGCESAEQKKRDEFVFDEVPQATPGNDEGPATSISVSFDSNNAHVAL